MAIIGIIILLIALFSIAIKRSISYVLAPIVEYINALPNEVIKPTDALIDDSTEHVVFTISSKAGEDRSKKESGGVNISKK